MCSRCVNQLHLKITYLANVVLTPQLHPQLWSQNDEEMSIYIIQVHDILVSNQTWFLHLASLITYNSWFLTSYHLHREFICCDSSELYAAWYPKNRQTSKTNPWIHEFQHSATWNVRRKWASGQSCLVTFPSSHALQYSSRRSPTWFSVKICGFIMFHLAVAPFFVGVS